MIFSHPPWPVDLALRQAVEATLPRAGLTCAESETGHCQNCGVANKVILCWPGTSHPCPTPLGRQRCAVPGLRRLDEVM